MVTEPCECRLSRTIGSDAKAVLWDSAGLLSTMSRARREIPARAAEAIDRPPPASCNDLGYSRGQVQRTMAGADRRRASSVRRVQRLLHPAHPSGCEAFARVRLRQPTRHVLQLARLFAVVEGTQMPRHPSANGRFSAALKSQRPSCGSTGGCRMGMTAVRSQSGPNAGMRVAGVWRR